MTAFGIWAEEAPVAVDTADYEIEVVLDATAHRLQAIEKIRWTNRTEVATEELFLHLYLNAFASSETTFLRELGRGSSQRRPRLGGNWGWVQIRRLHLDDGSDLLPAMEFVRPDDGNPNDFSAARIVLPRSVEPGEVVELELEFEAQLPEIVARTGYAGDFHLVGQWFPKLAVFEGERGWNCHQFHVASEFYADFGTYLVTITTPENWVVGATGFEVGRPPVEGDLQKIVYRAERVHDFAWMTAPPELMEVVEADFEPGRDVPVEWMERVRVLLGRSAADLELPPMKLRLILPRAQRGLAPRMIDALRLAVAWFGLHYGVYPYPQLTIVSPPDGAGAAGGMEYPTFITTGAESLDAHPPFSLSPDIEAVVVHEFGHQYFQGLLASNEFEEGWLDEGVTSYAENSCMAAILADHLAPQIGSFDVWGAERLALDASPLPATTSRMPWDFRHPWAYYLASYTKTALALRTLEGLIGSEAMARGLRNYTERYRFRHPTGRDLEMQLSGAAGLELGWFFSQAIGGDAVPDWSVLGVSHRRPRPPRGHEWGDAGWSETDGSGGGADGREEENAGWIVELEIARPGDFIGPVEVELLWSDGTVERRSWDGVQRWVRWRFEGSNRLEQVVIDPDVVWVLETRRDNNYWRDRPAAVDHPLWWLRETFDLGVQLFLKWS
jgi:hypothetical protein